MLNKKETPEICVDEIKAKIRNEVNRRRQAIPEAFLASSPSISSFSSINTAGIRSLISQAATFADAGAAVSPMIKFTGLKRKLALFIGKIVVYLASFITTKQRTFNNLVINSLQEITDHLDTLNDTLAEIKTVTESLSEEQVEEKTEICQLRRNILDQQNRLVILLEARKSM